MTTANRIDPRSSGLYLTFDSPSDFLATLGGRENPCTAIFRPRDYPTNAVDPEGLEPLTGAGFLSLRVVAQSLPFYRGNLKKFGDQKVNGATTIDSKTGRPFSVIDRDLGFNDTAITMAHEGTHQLQFYSGRVECGKKISRDRERTLEGEAFWVQAIVGQLLPPKSSNIVSQQARLIAWSQVPNLNDWNRYMGGLGITGLGQNFFVEGLQDGTKPYKAYPKLDAQKFLKKYDAKQIFE